MYHRSSPHRDQGSSLSTLRTLGLLLCLLLWGARPLQAEQTDPTYGLPMTLSPRAVISFLASDPHGEEVYTLYGHAGLRVVDPAKGMDVVFNYGLFEFSEDFIWRFIQGKTDYFVAPMSASDYFQEYLQHGAVHEVTLRTDSLQRASLWARLLRDIQPAHRTYRYNSFRDNCSTRPLALYFATCSAPASPASGHESLYLVDTSEPVARLLRERTWHDVINRLEAPSPWLVLGTDLALGSEVYEPISLRERLFIPTDAVLLLPHLRLASLGTAPSEAPSPVVSIQTYGEARPPAPAASWLTHPTTIFTLLLVLTGICYALRRRYTRAFYLYAAGLFFVGGLAGCVLGYLHAFSEHPMTDANWNLLILNPLLLLPSPLLLLGKRAKWLRLSLHLLLSLLGLVYLLLPLLLGRSYDNLSILLITLTLSVLHLGHLSLQYPTPTDED